MWGGSPTAPTISGGTWSLDSIKSTTLPSRRQVLPLTHSRQHLRPAADQLCRSVGVLSICAESMYLSRPDCGSRNEFPVIPVMAGGAAHAMAALLTLVTVGQRALVT